MSLRSLGTLLSRRLLSPGSGISRAQLAKKALAPAAGVPARSLHSLAKKALVPAAGVPARSLHSLRDFAVGDAVGAYGGVAAAALAGFVGILYYRKGADESAGELTKEVVAGEEETKVVVVTGEEETKEMTRQGAKKQLAGNEARKQGAIMKAETKEQAETKEHNDDDFSLEEYLAEMKKIAAAQKKARYERSCKKAIKEVTNSEVINDEAAIKDEAAMKARFEEWIKEYGKRYKNKEEKARRYELFKAFAKMVDKATAQGGAVFVTNHTADWTDEECQCLYDSDVDWDDYIDHIQSLIDKKNARAKKPSKV